MFVPDINITIPLKKTTLFRDKQLYGDFITLNRTSTLQVNFSEIRNDLAFVIFQVHSHLYNITLYKNVKQEGTYVTGTNLGLYSGDTMKSDSFFIQNLNKNDLTLYYAVHGYFDTGWCYTFIHNHLLSYSPVAMSQSSASKPV